MIYLIGGAPCVGKSLLAKRIAKQEGIEVLSTDHACDAFIETLSSEERSVCFPLGGFSGDPAKNVLTPQRHAALQVTSSLSLEPEIGRHIAESVAAGRPLIVEGVHLLPEVIDRLRRKYAATPVRALVVWSQDVERVVRGIAANTSPENWLGGSDPVVIRQVAESVAAFSAYAAAEAEKYGIWSFERTDRFAEDMSMMEGLLAERK